MNNRKMVLFYNHADPDESFVTMLTDEEIKQAREQETSVSRELYKIAEENAVKDVEYICYYA